MLHRKKAFDSVNHSFWLTKPEHYGVRGNVLKLIQTYLSNRKQYVWGWNAKSSSNSIISGVPEGLIFGPLFFEIL